MVGRSHRPPMIFMETVFAFSPTPNGDGQLSRLEHSDLNVFLRNADFGSPLFSTRSNTERAVPGPVQLDVSAVSYAVNVTQVGNAIVGPDPIDVVNLVRPSAIDIKPSQPVQEIRASVEGCAQITLGVRSADHIPSLPAGCRMTKRKNTRFGIVVEQLVQAALRQRLTVVPDSCRTARRELDY